MNKALPLLLVAVACSNGLQLRKINIVVVTDAHSWLSGHRHPDHDPLLDANAGDVTSFVDHIREMAAVESKDLFVLNNGDMVDGTGLSDASAVHGAEVFPIINLIGYDAINMGNHELYKAETLISLKDSGLINGSDVIAANILLTEDSTPFSGRQYTILEGQFGSKVLVFGFLYNMPGADPMVQVQQVEETVQQQWFLDVLATDGIDAIAVMAHMDVVDPLVTTILTAIRTALGDDMDVIFLTGHTHYRGYSRLDDHSVSFEAGHYLDTVGFVSLDLEETQPQQQQQQQQQQQDGAGVNGGGGGGSRRMRTVGSSGGSGGSRSRSRRGASAGAVESLLNYTFIDADKASLMRASGKSAGDFTTPHGKTVNDAVLAARQRLGLDDIVGCSTANIVRAPSTNTTNPNQVPDRNLYDFYMYDVVPKILFHRDGGDGGGGGAGNGGGGNGGGGGGGGSGSGDGRQWMLYQIQGSLRYNFYAGEIWRDDIYAVSPFKNKYYTVANLTGVQLLTVLSAVNATEDETWMTSAPLDASTVYELFVNDFDLFSAGVLEQLQTVVGAEVQYRLFSNTTTSTNVFIQYMATEMKCANSNNSAEMTAVILGVAAGGAAILAVVVVLIFVKKGRLKKSYQTIRT